MFRSQINPPRSVQKFSTSGLAANHSSLATAPLTPFPATLREKSQLTENSAALSRVVATLTHHVHHNPFVCHSYKKYPGSHLSCQRSFRSDFSRPIFLPTRHSPLATIVFVINTYKTDTKQTTLSSFRINTCAKTRGEGTSFQPKVSVFEFPFSNFALPLPLPTTHYSRKAPQLFTVAWNAAPSRSGCKVCKTRGKSAAKVVTVKTPTDTPLRA